MNNLDLTKLKIGATIYSTIGGECKVTQIIDGKHKNIAPVYPIMIRYLSKGTVDSYSKEGKLYNSSHGECVLFPSKECRDWSLYDFETGTIKVSNTKKVVFKGDREKGGDIINYLKELGGYNKYNVSAKDDENYYFIDKNNIINCLDETLYHLIEYSHKLLTMPPKLNDKDLVLCWNNNSCEGIIRFYDARNNRTFTSIGERNGFNYDNYEPYIGEYPDWAKEAVKLLED